jgi:hypothetical protein
MSGRLKTNPDIVLREECKDAGILFDPDTGKCVGLSPTAVFIWKNLDGHHTKEEILDMLGRECDGGLPAEASRDFDELISSLNKKGYLSVLSEDSQHI